MDLSSLLATKPSSSRPQSTNAPFTTGAFHHSSPQTYTTAKLALDTSKVPRAGNMASASPIEMNTGASAGSHSGSASPRQVAVPKHVQFELLFPQSPQYRARLPLRVQIYPHDDTESIISTVKNFYGLYHGVAGISFEDDRNNTLIARYENFSNNMVVHVRVIEDSPQPAGPFNPSVFQSSSLDYSAHQSAHHISRPGSRTSRRRSPSPTGGRRSTSVSTNPAGKKSRSRSTKNHGSNYDDSVNGYSSGDGAAGSVSSKAKDQIGNTDISVENIVEGGRRKRAKFESSELPLFAPPQMPASTSNPSVSPARRVEHQRPSLPFPHPHQNPFVNPRPLQSPQNYNGYSQQGIFATPMTESRRHRGSIGYTGNGSGILPTPDPTIGSCVSEEDKDVAIQLMRLGEMSNISHGRTSASTLDDTFSGKAELASSTGATSDSGSDNEGSASSAHSHKVGENGLAHNMRPINDNHFVPARDNGEASGDDADMEDGTEGSVHGMQPSTANAKTQTAGKSRLTGTKSSKPRTTKPKISAAKSKKSSNIATGPISPASLPNQSRKPSIASAMSGQPGDDEQPDLSTKPRCQRCRKSKKGCDRQRPCGRCRDAGLSADQCISEDEGNGRKGRYGRHMGVPIKALDSQAPPALLPAAPITVPIVATDKSKKRKR